jgi:UDP-glucose 4-epimerase
MDGETVKLYGDGYQIRDKGKLDIKPFPKDREKIEIENYIASYTKKTNTYGWKPKILLEAGIKRTIEYYKKTKNITGKCC